MEWVGRPKWWRVLVVCLFFLFSSACASGQLPMFAIRNIMVPMRDGVSLTTDVYLPEGDGPWPTILVRTPYGKSNAGPIDWDGFAVVVQDMRGYGDSQGVRIPFDSEGWGELQDGYDAVEWIAEQPWSNGLVGTYGASALGIVQNLMAGSYPPHLVCQHIAVAPFDICSQFVYRGGVLMKSFVERWMGAYSSQTLLDDWLAHPGCSSRWDSLNPGLRVHNMTYPAFHVGGWYDFFSQGTLDAFTERHYEGGPGSRGNQVLVMGPWTHNGTTLTQQGELVYPADTVYDAEYHRDAERFFDYWLRGEENGLEEQPAVTYYLMGDAGDPKLPGNEWKQIEYWPPPYTNLSLYLSQNSLVIQPYGNSSDEYMYDPLNPVPTIGGANIMLQAGPMDQRSVEARQDVLVYTTQPLKVPVEITGRVWVQLFASSSCPDTDFIAKLTDVYPDGRSMLVLDGAIRARYRGSTQFEELMEPGYVYEFWIDLLSTAIVFNKGHRIRLTISSSNYPRYDLNPNTGHPFRQNNETVTAINTILHGTSYPSRIILPLIGSVAKDLNDIIDPYPQAPVNEIPPSSETSLIPIILIAPSILTLRHTMTFSRKPNPPLMRSRTHR